jgi:hypothetical protein
MHQGQHIKEKPTTCDIKLRHLGLRINVYMSNSVLRTISFVSYISVFDYLVI